MCINVGYISIGLGIALIVGACWYLFHEFPRIAKKHGTTTTIVALRVCSWLVIGGLVMIVLGILYLMGAIPWVSKV